MVPARIAQALSPWVFGLALDREMLPLLLGDTYGHEDHPLNDELKSRLVAAARAYR